MRPIVYWTGVLTLECLCVRLLASLITALAACNIAPSRLCTNELQVPATHQLLLPLTT
jgi:hypothetical protein